MKHLATLITIVMTLFLAGCASVPMASGEQDVKAKEFATVADKANLYIYRNELIGAAIPMSVDINGKLVGQTAAKTYFQLLLDPGVYNLTSRAENDSMLSITLEANKNYFVWQEVKMGFLVARNQIQLVDEPTGRAGVAESKLIASADQQSGATATVSVDAAAGQGSDNLTPIAPSVPSVPIVPISSIRPIAALSSAAMPPAKSGKSAFAVEKLARRQSCEFSRGANLTASDGPTIESYQIQCNDGRLLLARCEYRQCAISP